MTDYERGYEQGKVDAAKKMHPEIRKFFEDYFDKCFKEYQEHARPWVGLTDDEIIDLIHPLVMADMADKATDYEIARAIEAKLKEKNEIRNP